MTSIRSARLFALATVLVCVAGLARSEQPAPYELVDLATAYTSFWDETQKLPTAERVAAFKTRFDKLLPGYYSIERVTWTTAEKYDARIARSFEKFPELRDRFQFFLGCEETWCALWAEGLATLVAHRLNPGATDAQLLLTSPKPLRPEVEKDRRAAVCAVASRLDSKNADDFGGLFSSGPEINGLPPRFGYYVGYLVAEEAAKGQTLVQLAHLDQKSAREVVNASLKQLATCVSP